MFKDLQAAVLLRQLSKKAITTLLSTVLCIFFTPLCQAAQSLQTLPKTIKTNQEIDRLYHEIKAKKNLSFAEKIHWFSAYFKGKPYQLSALGEGNTGQFDQYPQYRTDAFDCLTYVETVLALSLSDNLAQFKQTLLNIRYRNGQVDFIDRNHFTSLDWNHNNRRLLKDITPDITDKSKRPVYKTAIAIINKPNWYQQFTSKNIRLLGKYASQSTERLNQLKQRGSQLPVKQSSINYLPLSSLYHKEIASQHLFSQIPDASIIEIIRPNWDLKKQIGTCLNVSHLGFAIRKKGQLYFREASQTNKKVTDTLLTDYLKKYLNSPTVKGINIQKIIEQRSLVFAASHG